MDKNICMVFSNDWSDWDQVTESLRRDPHICLFLREPNPMADRIATIRGIETFFFQGPYPQTIGQIWQWGKRQWDYPQIPVWDPVASKFICHHCGNHIPSGLWCGKDCRVDTKPTPSLPRPQSSRSVASSEEDPFLANCCKSFVDPKDPKNQIDMFGPSKHSSKFMQTMMSKIERKDYLERKELFKKQLRVTTSTQEYIPQIATPHKNMCKAQTKKGKANCINKAIDGSDYCGIPSHRKLSQPTPQPNPQPLSAESH